jgi:hypothetical protein
MRPLARETIQTDCIEKNPVPALYSFNIICEHVQIEERRKEAAHICLVLCEQYPSFVRSGLTCMHLRCILYLVLYRVNKDVTSSPEDIHGINTTLFIHDLERERELWVCMILHWYISTFVAELKR